MIYSTIPQSVHESLGQQDTILAGEEEDVLLGIAVTRHRHLFDEVPSWIKNGHQKTIALGFVSGRKSFPVSDAYFINAIFWMAVKLPLRARRKYMPLAWLRPSPFLPSQTQLCQPVEAGPSCRTRTRCPRRS